MFPYVGHLCRLKVPTVRADPNFGTCAERDSPKSHFIVISFLVITSILLAIAGLKHYGIDLQVMSSRMGLRGMLTVSFSVFQLCQLSRRNSELGGTLTSQYSRSASTLSLGAIADRRDLNLTRAFAFPPQELLHRIQNYRRRGRSSYAQMST